MSVQTIVGWHFCATHRAPITHEELHGHSYEVTAWFDYSDRDAEVRQELLKGVLRGFDHRTLPDELSRCEALAQAIGQLMDGCTRVRVWRPLERLGAEVALR